MRSTCIPAFNTQQIEIFVHRRGSILEGCEVWIVGSIEAQRMVLAHFITHHDLESRIHYASPGDVIWRTADRAEIPGLKSPGAVELEATIKRETYLDHDVLAWHCNAMLQLKLDRKVCNSARRCLVGTWSDGIACITFYPNGRLAISCPEAPSHPLFVSARLNCADTWRFSAWRLFLMNDAKEHGERMTVWHCDEHELHLNGKSQDSLAHVLRRVVAASESTV